MILSIGLFVFSVPTLLFDELSRRRGWRFAANQRIGARDALQPVGPDEDKISLTGSAPLELQDGQAGLDNLAAMAATQQAWSLVDATGRCYGDWVIVGLDERGRGYNADFQARSIEFQVELILASDAGASARL